MICHLHHRSFLRLALLLSVVVCSWGLPGDIALAQPSGQVQTPSETFLPSYLRERMARRVSSRRDSTAITALMQPLALPIGASAVEVLVSGRRVSLGTIVRSDGYIVTKASELVDDAPLRIRFSDDRIMTATVVDQRRSVDLALLKTNSRGLQPVQWSESEPPVGSFVVSVGRQGDSVGIGVVSVASRQVRDRGLLGVLLQTDFDDGARVLRIVPGSGAADADVREGDIIETVDGVVTKTHQEVTQRLRDLYPGDDVRLGIRRGDADAPMVVSAEIRELSSFAESSADTRVNGPRNSRLTGFALALQHDTVLGPDQCGGPVIDTRGQVIGINIARAGRVCSYAVPSAAVKPMIEDMLQKAAIR